MAKLIEDTLYRVQVDSEYHMEFVSAKDVEDLARFVVDQFIGEHEVYGASRVNHDGTTRIVPLVTNPLYQELKAEKLAELAEREGVSTDKSDSGKAKFKCRLVTAAEWDRLVEVTGGDDEKMHWDYLSSWCQDVDLNRMSDCLNCGFDSPHSKDYIFSGIRSTHFGFRPVLEALDTDIAGSLKNGDVVRGGALSLGGQIVGVPECPTWDGDIHEFNGAQISIVDADDAKVPIPWFVMDGLLVADRNLLNNISWDDLDQQGLVFGKEVTLSPPVMQKQTLLNQIAEAKASGQSAQKDVMKRDEDFER